MILASIAVALCGVAAWNVVRWQRVGHANRARGTVSILIPARNEEQRLPVCLESLVGQEAVEILVYNDHSEDGTGSVIEYFARRDPRFRAIAPVPLPSGWCGKNFACAQLATHATGDWLLFLDADVRLMPGAVLRIAGEAERRALTLLSCWPGFATQGFWEAVLMPMLNFLVFTLFPAPLSAVRTDASLGIAHGACLLARCDVYRRLGGHTLVRNEIFEDTRLAQEWRAHGERALCLDGQDVVHVRMYSGFREIWQGFGKNFYPAFRHGASFWLFLLLHAAVFLWPFLRGDIVTVSFVLGARLLLALRFRQPAGQKFWSVILHPLGEAVLLALALSSWWQWRSGQGVVWKGRVVRT